MEWTRADGYAISTDPARLDLDVVHAYLSTEAYWSPGVPREVVERAVAHSLNFGLYDSAGAQAGFARLVTDQATFAWLADVFVLPPTAGGAWASGWWAPRWPIRP